MLTVVKKQGSSLIFTIAVMAFASLLSAGAQTVFNCPSFAATGGCGVNAGTPGNAFAVYNGNLVGSAVQMVSVGAGHDGYGFMYQTPVKVQAFTSTFTFIPDGQNFAFTLNNQTTNPGYNGPQFRSGAGCEGGFYQAYGTYANNIFALMFDSYSPLTNNASFTNSSVQIYHQNESPCNPNDSAPDYYLINKISTSPVAFNSPATTQNTSTGHTYSATIAYTGTNLTLTMYDVTGGGSCPGSSCFTYTWPVMIPPLVSGTTAYVGFDAGIGLNARYPQYISSFSYTELSPAAAPTFSPGGNSYAAIQPVTISDPSPGSVICYNTTGAPATNGGTGCANGMLYTGPISVSGSQTIYAVAGGAGYGDSSVSLATYVIGSTAAQPTFSVSSGKYNGNQAVRLSTTNGSVICYNTTGAPATNGSTGCTTGTLYAGPIVVSSNETLYAAAGGTGLTDSSVSSAMYKINPWAGAAPANSPTYSPLPGSYAGTQSVTLASSTASSYICYLLASSPPTLTPQTDNQGGCLEGTLYSGPVTVSATQTLYAMASTRYLGPPSSLTSGGYTIGASSVASTPAFSPGTGSYTSAQSVTITDATSGATIYYTTNGTTPTTSSTAYTGPITVSATETLQAIATAAGDTNSAVGAAEYTIAPPPVVATPAFSPGAGTYTSAQTVTLSDATTGATIYYTTNGSTPTTSSIPYTAPVTVSSTETMQAIAIATGDTNSGIASAAYTINLPVVATPAFSPAPGTYTSAQTVTVSDATPGATIYYTTNGSTPTTSSIPYTGPVTVSSTETMQAIAVATGDTNSAIASAAYTITPAASTPAFFPAAGTYSSAQSVTLSDATPGATIYYTTNGSTPTTSSIPYTGPVTVSSTETIQAIAAATGNTNSAVASAVYTISVPVVSTPAFSPAAGTYSSAQSVMISDTTPAAIIYYTTNGSTPTTSSIPYTGPVTVSSTETLQAIAVAAGDTNSAVASAVYTIAAAPTATNFAIGTTVQQSAVKRLGINLGGQNYYDSGQLSRNLTVRNPGFEAEIWSSLLNCQAATATTCTDTDPNTVWPANFLAAATFQFIYGAANGQTGTVTANTVSNSSTGVTLTFSAPLSPAPAVGDVVKVQMQVPGNPQAGWWTSASGGATFSADTTDLSPETPGKQALAVNAAASGQSAQVTSYFDSYSGRSFVQLNGTYTLTFRAKAVSGSNQINVSLVRTATPVHGNVSYLNQNVTLTNQWQDYSYTFNAAEDGTYVGTVGLTFSIASAQIYLDDVALTEPAAPNNPTVFRNAVLNTLRTLQPGVLRFMDGGADFASTTDNMIAVPFARLRAGYGEGQTEQDDISIGLHDFLVLCQAVGAEPWYTVPAGISPADMQHLIQYLAGDASTPYGAIRASLGQSAPWTSLFPTIHLELGNEMWNAGSFAGEAVPNPVAYGNIAAAAFAAARASAAYNPANFDLVMDSWAVEPSWTSQELTSGSGADSVDVAPYLFNSLNDYGSNEAIFGPMFAQPEQVDSSPSASGNYMYQQAQAVATAPSPTRLAVYEVNLSTTSGTASQSVVNQAAAGLGAGIAVADHMLLMMRDLGITTQNMFALPEYVNGFTNPPATGETVPLWGAVIDMGGETNLKRPQFLAEQLANSAILPTMLATTVSGANPTWNQPLSTNDSIQLSNAHDLQSFVFTDGSHYNVVVFNLSRTGPLPVTFSGSNAPSGNVVISQLTSTNPTDNNEALFTNNPVVAGPTRTNVSSFNPATPYSLPPYSMTVLSWPGAVLPASYTALQASPTSANSGQTVTLTATVSSQSGTNTPAGAVTFLNGSTTLGTATLNAGGVATFTITTLPIGTDSITASYGGDPLDAGSTSQPVTVTITPAIVATNTVLIASATAITTGQNVTFTATVSPQSGSNVPTGAITFKDGSTILGTAQLNGSGVATFSTASLASGTQSITASYGGDGKDYSSISGVVSVVVTQGTVASSTTLSASATLIGSGQNVTFTATVTPQIGNNVPTGTVTFKDGSIILGTAKLNASGVATFSTTALPPGTQLITASYGGDGKDYGSISPTVTVVVTAATVATTTTLSASAAQIAIGQSVTFTATVTPNTGSIVATGVVTFLDGKTSLGTAQLNGSGVATFTTTSLGGGTQSITASYAGDTRNAASVSGAVSVVVTGGSVASTTALSASATQIIIGQTITFTATVASQSGGNVPTGTITFKDESINLGRAKLSSRGVATLSTTALAVGTQLITASYGGDDNNYGSNSPSVTIVVVQSLVVSSSNTTLAASATQLTPGESVTFTATVAPQVGSSLATGTVTFLDGNTTLGTSSLNGSGIATFSTATLSSGTHSIVASYAGDSHNGSSLSTAVIVTVTAIQQGLLATATTLTASANQLLPADSVTFTAVVSPLSGSNVPTGTVTFYDGSTSLGAAQLNANGGATLNLTSLPLGTHSISASYGGDTNDSPSISASLTVSVSAPEYAMVVSATSIDVTMGQPSTLNVTLIPENGFNLPINLACSGLPKGTICTFTPSTVTPNGAPVISTVTITTSAQATLAAPGSGLTFAWVMPWGFIPLLGLATTRRRSRFARWSFRLAVATALTAGSLWVSGCGYSSNGGQYLVTLTASASNAQTHTSQITVHVQK